MAVEDEGPGIAPEDQDRVFQRFWRGDAANGEARRSGLGLTIVRQIAEAHGGEVRLVSEPGAGAAFAIWLPGAKLAYERFTTRSIGSSSMTSTWHPTLPDTPPTTDHDAWEVPPNGGAFRGAPTPPPPPPTSSSPPPNRRGGGRRAATAILAAVALVGGGYMVRDLTDSHSTATVNASRKHTSQLHHACPPARRPPWRRTATSRSPTWPRP